MFDPLFDPLGHQMSEGDVETLRRLISTVKKRIAPIRPQDSPTVVEIGSWVGGSALVFADADCTVHCVDHSKGNPQDHLGETAQKLSPDEVFRTFCGNVGRRLFRTVHPHHGSSLLFASVWNMMADLVFIDAEHTYEACKADSEAWWPHVRPKGMMVWHDYGAEEGVTQAVDEFGFDSRVGRVAWKFK